VIELPTRLATWGYHPPRTGRAFVALKAQNLKERDMDDPKMMSES
jgi:hypothetical protein